MDILASSHVAIFGIGGVGGYAAEALARCGIGEITLVDNDEVSMTNINRQIIAALNTIGQNKAHVMAERISHINPDCITHPRNCFYLPATKDEFDVRDYDYVGDALDTVTAKFTLIEETKKYKVPLISCMGTANKLNPQDLEVCDIKKTHECRFARIMRKECRKRGITSLKVIYSHEPLRERKGSIDIEQDALRPGRRDVPGTVSFVPGTAGLLLASEIVKDLLKAHGAL